MAKTVTTTELIKMLKAYPATTKVYLSSDSEGNSFATINDDGWSEEYHKEDGSLALFPYHENMESEEVWPEYSQKEME